MLQDKLNQILDLFDSGQSYEKEKMEFIKEVQSEATSVEEIWRCLLFVEDKMEKHLTQKKVLGELQTIMTS